MTNLRSLDLSSNQLTGVIPVELINLTNLRSLDLSSNQLTGVIPVELINLTNLEYLNLRGNSLCEPADSAFQAWVNSIEYYYPPTFRCSARTFAEIFQVTQQPGLHGREEGGFVAPEALLEGRVAVLRVAPLAEEGSGDRVSHLVKVTYRGKGGVEVELIPKDKGPYDKDIPRKVDFSSLGSTFNLKIPAADVQRPDLEIWVEVWRTSSSGVTTADTIYKKVPVQRVDALELTLVPVLYMDPESKSVDYGNWGRLDSFAKDVARQGIDHEALEFVRKLLPVVEVNVNAAGTAPGDSVGATYSDHWNAEGIVSAVEVYVDELARPRGYYMGVIATRPIDDAIGAQRGANGYSMVFEAGTLAERYHETIAHELAHGFGLDHAPCTSGGVRIEDIDTAFPHTGAVIGAWGYDSGELVPNTRRDLMSYCYPQWISHYNFQKMRNWRWIHGEIYGDRAVVTMSAAAEEVLRLWGGTRPDGTLYLKPAFLREGVPKLPDAGGPYRIAGRNSEGETLFSLSFAMTEIADAPAGVSGFSFSIPVRPEWEGELASIQLEGPEGSVTLDGNSDRAMAIVNDPVTGLLGIFHDLTPSAAAELEMAGARENRQVTISRGVPNELRRRP